MDSARAADGRHLSLASIHEYLSGGSRAVVLIAGLPEVKLVIDGTREAIAVETLWDGVAPPDLAYEHLSADVLFRDDENWAVLEVTGRVVLDEAYPALISLIDRLQLQHQSFNEAVAEIVSNLQELLLRASQLTHEREVGLYGELLVLERLISRNGPQAALQSWVGPASAEHDFSVAIGDLEVKTTTSERRSHVIHGLGQLTPSPSRELYLLSLQITTAGTGPGRSLAGVISDLRAALAVDVGPFDAALHSAGWRDEMTGRAWSLMRLRSKPLCLHATSLPAITETVLSAGGLDLARLSDLSYRLDITGLTEAAVATDEFSPEGAPP